MEPPQLLGHRKQKNTQGQITRTRTGCFTCRFRRKRCSERKPECDACVRNGLICTWPSDTSALTATAHDWPAQQQSGIQCSRIESSSQSPMACQRPSTLSHALRNENSRLLFEAYVCRFSHRCSSRPRRGNPVHAFVLPLAQSNSLVLNCLLAESAALLSFESQAAKNWVPSYYSVALRDVKHRLTDVFKGDLSNLPDLIHATLSLAEVENAIAESSVKPSYHLKACRKLWCLAVRSGKLGKDSPIFRIEEAFTYCSIVSKNLHWHLDSGDGFRFDKEDMPWFFKEGSEKDRVEKSLLMGHAGSLIELIPTISVLARRLAKNGADSFLLQEYAELQAFLSNWTPLESKNTYDDEEKEEENQSRLAGFLYQQALLLFLFTSRFSRQAPMSGQLRVCSIHVEHFCRLVKNLPEDSATWTIMAWPLLVVGSCCDTIEHRTIIAEILRSPKMERIGGLMAQRCICLLKEIWVLGADQAYGPYGLEKLSGPDKDGFRIS